MKNTLCETVHYLRYIGQFHTKCHEEGDRCARSGTKSGPPLTGMLYFSATTTAIA